MIMDSLASLALATETPKDELLKRPPYRKKEYIVNRKMIKHIMCMAVVQTALLFTVIFAGFKFFPEGVEGKFNGCDKDGKEIMKDGVLGGNAKKTNDSIGLTCAQVHTHPVEKYKNWPYTYVMNGMVRDLDGTEVYEPFSDFTPSRHLTIVFNVFVLLQIFNMLASRKINDELWIFKDVTTNPMFMSVWLAICFFHYVIIQYGSIVMNCHRAGLTPQ